VIELCRTSGKSIAQVARDLELSETALRRWIAQAEIDARPASRAHDRRARRAGGAAQGEQGASRRARHPEASNGFLRPQGDPVKVDPFIEAEVRHEALCVRVG
jgi:transposase-like protein